MGTTCRTPSPRRESYSNCDDDSSPEDQQPSSPQLVPQASQNFSGCQKSESTRLLGHWHGLPSPQTPTFTHDRYGTLPMVNTLQPIPTQNGEDDATTATISKTKVQFGAEILQQVTERDTDLARELEAIPSPTSLRRSSRISTKTKKPVLDVAQPAVAPVPKSAKTGPMVPTAPPQEISIPPFQIDPIRFEGLPALHTVDWQLQYPPGGSAHPSYPYPSLDPRLIFHENMVPMSNGLPDISRLPKLLLPMGWSHISWSGLLPIVFDPYRQAFKLTPVGPMSITCEELHQNGLYKYVPGGEQHPETALLPQMIALSDGSDAEVYDWEGVDWVLPWNEMNNASGSQSTSVGLASPVRTEFDALQHAQQLIAPAEFIHYNEGWDCPDGIVDLTDAWRWLGEKEQKPGPIFKPSKGKTWKGTGIHLVSRRFKQPIASLMAGAIATITDDPEGYLVKQDQREFCPFRSVATPINVNIALLADIEITLKELLCYFPNHFQWRKCGDRLVRAGLGGSDIANMINMTRCLSGDAARKIGTISHHITYETGEDGTRVRIVRSDDEEKKYTADGWTYEAWELSNYPLLGLAHGLLELPQGEDAGPLTRIIRWCRTQHRYNTLLSEVSTLLDEEGVSKQIERTFEDCPDKGMLARHAEAMKEDRKRVLKSEKMKRLALEDADNDQGKRRRTR
ncbi:hypothetical protein N0V83_009141 [Neocucurbitaria cava]|uniref:Uncharacterized protein n=1 Tax=Neocucurbitaria cava TaxID=798079 RepID=A0A9W9CIP3_9PLEO|nr:hypothetical protein N0V83_009141 [Neocucurbitaria cava]